MVSPIREAAVRCGSCGNELRPQARFCDGCGARVAARSSAGEHKQVTVLFADVVGSMNLASALDAERLREIMHELFNRAAAAVQRYQGMVDKFTGDGLMALFGAPSALEDHALRACIAALEIQSVATQLAAEVDRRDGVALRLRIGLNSGDVIVGEIGSGPGSFTGRPGRWVRAAEPVAVAAGTADGARPGRCGSVQNGKTVTRRLSQTDAKLYQEWISNDRKLRKTITRMRQVAAKASDLMITTANKAKV